MPIVHTSIPAALSEPHQMHVIMSLGFPSYISFFLAYNNRDSVVLRRESGVSYVPQHLTPHVVNCVTAWHKAGVVCRWGECGGLGLHSESAGAGRALDSSCKGPQM